MQTRSMFAESNGRKDRCLDGQGSPARGEIITGEGVILRFQNGLLDGDTVYSSGSSGIALSLPAVEAPGHLEWWREGRLHRDNGLPAVVSDNFTLKEWWVNGLRKREGRG